MADLIPSEIWSNHIFIKLPSRSLSRVRCVCKAWNDAWKDAISDRSFVRRYILRKDQHVYLEYINEDGSIYAFDCEINDTDGTCIAKPAKKIFTEIKKIMRSSNGVFFGLVRISDKDDLAIWSPSTGDFKLIPPPVPYFGYAQYGFYYDPLTGDATIVMFEYNRIGKSQPHIYSSLQPNSWKLIENSSSIFDQDVIVRGYYTDGNGCSSDGFIYWMVDKRKEYIAPIPIVTYSGLFTLELPNTVMETDFFIEWILVFDIKKRKFGTIQPPFSRTPAHYLYMRLGILGSSIVLYGLPLGRELVVWTLKEGKSEEWIKLDITLPESVYWKYPQCLIRNRKILLQHSTRFGCPSKIVKLMLYDLQNQDVQHLTVSGINNISCDQQIQDSINTRWGLQDSINTRLSSPKKYVAFVSLD